MIEERFLEKKKELRKEVGMNDGKRVRWEDGVEKVGRGDNG